MHYGHEWSHLLYWSRQENVKNNSPIARHMKMSNRSWGNQSKPKPPKFRNISEMHPHFAEIKHSLKLACFDLDTGYLKLAILGTEQLVHGMFCKSHLTIIIWAGKPFTNNSVLPGLSFGFLAFILSAFVARRYSACQLSSRDLKYQRQDEAS